MKVLKRESRLCLHSGVPEPCSCWIFYQQFLMFFLRNFVNKLKKHREYFQYHNWFLLIIFYYKFILEIISKHLLFFLYLILPLFIFFIIYSCIHFTQIQEITCLIKPALCYSLCTIVSPKTLKKFQIYHRKTAAFWKCTP